MSAVFRSNNIKWPREASFWDGTDGWLQHAISAAGFWFGEAGGCRPKQTSGEILKISKFGRSGCV